MKISKADALQKLTAKKAWRKRKGLSVFRVNRAIWLLNHMVGTTISTKDPEFAPFFRPCSPSQVATGNSAD